MPWIGRLGLVFLGFFHLLACRSEEAKPSPLPASIKPLVGEGLQVQIPLAFGRLELEAKKAEGRANQVDLLQDVRASLSGGDGLLWRMQAARASQEGPQKWRFWGGVRAQHQFDWVLESPSLELTNHGAHLSAQGPLRLRWGAWRLEAQHFRLTSKEQSVQLMGRVRGEWRQP